MTFATITDLQTLWRPITSDEMDRALELLEVVSDSLRVEADKVGKNLDLMLIDKPHLKSVAKSVVVDVVARTLMTSTSQEPMTQMTQSALGYSVQGDRKSVV